MKQRVTENRRRSKTNKAENWMDGKLLLTGRKWTRQAQWGYRIFDFWNSELGIAIEVDGDTHIKEYDDYRDRKNSIVSAIIVLRVKNFSEDDARKCIDLILTSDTWNERRKKAGLQPIKEANKGNKRKI